MKILFFLLLLPMTGEAQENYSRLLKEYMQEQVMDKGFSGSVLVVKNDRILLKAGYGMADREWNIPNGPTVKYRIGSISKQFTAFCIMKLAEEGKLRLEDRLSKYFPDFPKADSVTIHMLLNHGSGISNINNLSEYQANLAVRLSKDSIVRLVAKMPYDFSPGTDFRYSNTGYFLLGYIVEKASGESFDHYLRHHILHPLGLGDTGVDSDDLILPERAQGYQDLGGNSIRCGFISMDWLLGCGQLYSTIDDLYAWEKAYTGNAVLGSRRCQIRGASPSMRASMQAGMSFTSRGPLSFVKTRKGTIAVFRFVISRAIASRWMTVCRWNLKRPETGTLSR